MPSPSPAVRTVKTYAVTPRPNPQTPRQLHLSAWDTAMLSVHYIQKGLLFKNPSDLSVEQIIEHLRSSLEEALFHYYPLSGRIRAVTCEGGGVTSHVEVGCEGEGAEFVHAVADGIAIADVVGADGQDLPDFLKQFFPLDLAVNFDGSTNPLVAVQVTVLIDGIFIGYAFNHVIGDGTSFWMFFNAWAEVARCKAAGKEVVLSQAGLGASTIAALPSYQYQRYCDCNNNDVSDGNGWLQCAICIGMLQIGEMVRSIPACKHLFHVECVDMWLKSHSTCPLCRGSVAPTDATSNLVAEV